MARSGSALYGVRGYRTGAFYRASRGHSRAVSRVGVGSHSLGQAGQHASRFRRASVVGVQPWKGAYTVTVGLVSETIRNSATENALRRADSSPTKGLSPRGLRRSSR